MPTDQEIEDAITEAVAQKAAAKQQLADYLKNFRDQEMSVDQEFLTKLITFVTEHL